MKTFLPSKDPLNEYITSSKSLDRLADIADQLPKLLLTSKIQNNINSLKINDLSVDLLIKNKNIRELKLAMVQLSFISHAYIWGAKTPSKVLPEALAKPWTQVANILGRPPILSYASYCLDNWYRLNKKENISLENVGLLTNFLGGVDEDWFVTIHVCIEDAARGAIAAADSISKLNYKNSVKDFSDQLKLIISSLRKVNAIFSRMPEKCDPYVYYHRVRPFIFGTKDNPDLKKGLIYKNQYNNKPQFFRGETGAQSSIMPFLDGALGIYHTEDHLRHYLNEMRDYMPPKHRRSIEIVEKRSNAKSYILESKKLTSEYNKCLEEIRIFRAQHLEFAATYIHKQSQITNPFGRGGSTITGTGGTPFMKYLKKHRDETQKQKI
ncbi:indoleamine 2,3-dioxygenase [Gammaproteobacteria bacterium]|nr:indoleamine 2,3-dioxygenase [Gammaproteobacteria bacterium]MDC3313199.1 indoleamine 2,3-dioxygenase [Gammaproteobacteria bacterium]